MNASKNLTVLGFIFQLFVLLVVSQDPSPPTPEIGETEPTQPPLPCDRQNNQYVYDSLQCSESPQHPGLWIVTNSDPYNCQGYCDYNILTPPTEDDDTPCEYQTNSPYSYDRLQCSENPENPGVWIETNSDRFNCEGYCLYDTTTSTSTTFEPPITFDDSCTNRMEHLIYECEENRTNPGKWIMTDDAPWRCKGHCEYNIPPTIPTTPCDQQTNTAYYWDVLQCIESLENPGVWIKTNSDPYNCEGYCQYPPTTIPTTSTTPTTLCDQQTNSPYYRDALQCSESLENPGVWVQTNLDPYNCEGYCEYNLLTSSTTSTTPCDQQENSAYFLDAL
jgi:hypothetical protein